MMESKLRLYWLVLLVLATQKDLTHGQLPPEIAGDNPCDNHQAIHLPDSGQCVVPVTSPRTWTTAQALCEEADGKLYQLPSSLQNVDSKLLYCVASQPNATPSATDFWVNAVAVWSPQFYWVNGQEVSPVKYCTQLAPAVLDDLVVNSLYLSVDYCVETCHEASATYSVIHNSKNIPECYCFFQFGNITKKDIVCDTTAVSYNNHTHYFIAEAKQDAIIRVLPDNRDNMTRIMCATVDSRTQLDRKMGSESCFHSRGFICDLGKGDNCQEDESCTGSRSTCRFVWKGSCLKRDNSAYTWYEARILCQKLGGDLWTMTKMEEMTRFTSYMTEDVRYWIGASNFRWYNNTSSGTMASHRSQSSNIQCGRLHVDHLSGAWAWNHTGCDVQKSFLCQFDQGSSKSSKIDDDVTCPWPIVVPPTHSYHRDNDSFPVAALISGIVAGLVLLTAICAGVIYCCRRQWMYKKLKKARQYLEFIPYFAESSYGPQGSAVEFEAMSNAHNMSYNMSDYGSHTGLIQHGSGHGGHPNAYALNSSYRETSTSTAGASGVDSDKSLDRRNKDSMQRKLNDTQNFLASQNSSMDATYSTVAARSKDYMTLQGEMNIQDDGIYGTLRRKPEVTLVTDHGDLNFTVNHAVSQGHADMSRISLDKTMEEVTLPPAEGGLTLPLPDRVSEAKVISHMAHHLY